MNRSEISLALGVATVIVLTGLGAPGLSAQEAAGAGALEEIIVTARKTRRVAARDPGIGVGHLGV